METIIACSKYGWETVTETYQRVTNPQKPIPDLHALIIGIDSYEKVVPLSGAVSDANSMERYLKVDLSVPCDHVTNLRNQQATRSAIVDAFRRLRDSAVIRPLDPIVIYYAGHGSEVDTPNSRKSNGPKTQCIVPQDVGLRDERGSIVSPIPDYVLSAMLYDLAEAKGNNITVIFDCCHSASSTRGLLDTYRIPHAGALTFPTLRSFNYPVMNLKSPRETIDTSSFGTNKVRYVDPASLPVLDHCFDGCPSLSRLPFNTRKTFRRGMRTHVLLAACGQSELAFECETVRNGYFTSTLLSVLRGSQIDKISYKSCLASFPLLKTPRPQNPVCEGEHVGRLFFNASIPGAHRSFIPVEQTEAGYTLEAGIAQGIFPGSVFSVHTNNVLGSDNPPLGTAVVTPVVDKPSASICNLDPAIFGAAPVPALLYARLIDVRTDPPLKVFLTGSFDLSCPRNAQLHDQNIVTSRDDAHIILDVDQSEHITFEIANSFVNAFGLTTLPRTILSNPSMVKTVLDATELWRWHVSRVPPVRPFASNVRMEFYQLDEDHHHSVGKNLNKDGVATLAVREHESYGFKIVNESTRDLYPYLLFFSTVNQSIRPLFLKVFGSASVDPPLEAGTELTSDHLAPLYFHLGSTKVDVGMFRLFVTTCPADFESVAQPSPFSVLGCVAPGEDEFTDGVCVECGAGNQGAPTVRSVRPAVDQVLFGQSVAGETSRSSEPAIAEPPSMPVEQISGSLPLPTQDITNKSSPLSLEGPRVRRLVDDEDEVDAQIELQSMWDVIDMQIVLRVAG